MSKQKQAVFVDVSRHREERRAPNDKRLIYTQCLMRLLSAYAGCMQNQKLYRVAMCPDDQTRFKCKFSFSKPQNVKKRKRKDMAGPRSVVTKYPSEFLALDIQIFKVMVAVRRHTLPCTPILQWGVD